MKVLQMYPFAFLSILSVPTNHLQNVMELERCFLFLSPSLPLECPQLPEQTGCLRETYSPFRLSQIPGPVWFFLTVHNLWPSHWPQVGKLMDDGGPHVFPHILGSLHAVLESQDSQYHTINEWNESRWWNFRHHVMAAVKIIFGQGPFLASLRMHNVGSCPAHSSLPYASNGEWDKKKSWLL